MRALSRVLIALLVSATLGTATTLAEQGDELSAVLAKFDAVQASFHTLSAHFTETTVNELLRDPAHSEGFFYLTKPDSVMWQYTSPEKMQFVVADGQYLGYFPGRKRAERRDVQRWREQIFRFFGLGQVSSELRTIYDIRLEPADESMPNTHLLVLDPRKRKVRKRMDSVRFWVDQKTYLPVRVEYRDRSGNTRSIRFRDVRVNPELATNHYDVQLPADVTVTTGFAGLQSLSAR